jgi:CMP-N-acetylneuraminic acid synthetase
MGSQRLTRKNLREIDGVPLIAHAIRRCKVAACFDEIWVNSEDAVFGEIARTEGVAYHQRPRNLADNHATSEDYVYEFLTAHVCDYMFQVHSIAPLLTSGQIRSFVDAMTIGNYDVLLSCVHERIECALDSMPINFSFEKKTNSQDLRPVQRITWSITGWRPATYIAAYKAGKTATYAGDVGFREIDRLAGHIIKTNDDLEIARTLMALRR